MMSPYRSRLLGLTVAVQPICAGPVHVLAQPPAHPAFVSTALA
jgi:hypothetical protein